MATLISLRVGQDAWCVDVPPMRSGDRERKGADTARCRHSDIHAEPEALRQWNECHVFTMSKHGNPAVEGDKARPVAARYCQQMCVRNVAIA